MELINKYFPSITSEQRERFAALNALYRDWNSKINVISRKDIDNLYEHHILHSLGIAKLIAFKPGSRIWTLAQAADSRVSPWPSCSQMYSSIS